LQYKIVNTYQYIYHRSDNDYDVDQISATASASSLPDVMDITSTFYDSYVAASNVYNKTQLSTLPRNLDDNFLPTHLIACKYLTDKMVHISKEVDAPVQASAADSILLRHKHHDIYKDAYIAEASLALEPLNNVSLWVIYSTRVLH